MVKDIVVIVVFPHIGTVLVCLGLTVTELTGSLHFGALRPRSRHADQETAKLKWEVLPDSLQDRVLELFETVEWPVIKQFQEDRKKTEAQVAVSSITRT